MTDLMMSRYRRKGILLPGTVQADKTKQRSTRPRLPGRQDELRDVAVAVVKSQTAAQIQKRTGLGVRGGGMVARGALK